jgi:biopolymer transport protein ExbD
MAAMKYFEVKKARIEIIPMIDIMFFLLVFFIMITLHMIPSSGITSNLAKSSTATPLDHPKMVVAVDEAGSIKVEDRTLSPVELTALLKQKGDPAHTIVTIAGSKATSLQNLMKVMDACRAAGVTQIGLAAQQQQ